MISRYATIGRGRGRLVSGLLIALFATGLTDAADPTPAPGSPVVTIPGAEQDGVEPGLAVKPVPKPIADAIAALRATDVRNPKRWATAARDLVRIGKPAVPYLIEELDRTTENPPLRSLGFTLRAIGDPRAVPALIRAIPRTLVVSGSDFGLRMDDPDLLAFLQKHDLHDGADGRQFTFGMPYREITGALHALTGQRFNEDELHFINLEGTPKQRWLKLWLFHQLAARWAVWWKQNWRRFTDDPAYSRINLSPLPEAPPVPAAAPDQPFPTGEKVRASSGWSGVTTGPPQPLKYVRTFKDLDTGRDTPWPGELPEPSKAKADEVASFAAREGFDLRGTEYTDPKSGKSYYALEGLGLRAWQVDNGVFDTIDRDLRHDRPPKLDRPARALLMDVDPGTGTYRPENKATFLFVTREGTTGILQTTRLVTELYRPEDIGKPVQRDPPDPPGKPAPLKIVRGFFRGAQYRYMFVYAE
jgi:hypothetical protein